MSADATTGVWGRVCVLLRGGGIERRFEVPRRTPKPDRDLGERPDPGHLKQRTRRAGLHTRLRTGRMDPPEHPARTGPLPAAKGRTVGGWRSACGDALQNQNRRQRSKQKVTYEPERYAWERNGETWEAIPAPELACNIPEVGLSAGGEVAMLDCAGEAQAFLRSGGGWEKQGAALVGSLLQTVNGDLRRTLCQQRQGRSLDLRAQRGRMETAGLLDPRADGQETEGVQAVRSPDRRSAATATSLSSERRGSSKRGAGKARNRRRSTAPSTCSNARAKAGVWSRHSRP